MTICSKQFSKLHNIVSTRKQQRSGKHAILQGQTIVATAENFKQLEIAASEQEAKVCSWKQQKLITPCRPALNLPTCKDDCVGYNQVERFAERDSQGLEEIES
jgi:hypothetical protein